MMYKIKYDEEADVLTRARLKDPSEQLSIL